MSVETEASEIRKKGAGLEEINKNRRVEIKELKIRRKEI